MHTKLPWYSNKWVQVILHSVVWVLMFSLPFILPTSYGNKQHPQEKPHYDWVYLYSCTAVVWIGFFYVNAYVLIPRYIYKKRFWLYILSQLLFIVILMAADRFFFWLFLEPDHRPYSIAGFITFHVFPYLFILVSSTAYQFIEDRMRLDKLAKDRENENLKTELAFLRSQVSPHFMFNVLNNMVSLARKQSDLLEPSLIKLSSLMRYMLYETDEEKVPLDREIEYLQSYIDLQQQRFGKKVKVNVNVQVSDGHYEVEPMLLIPFVENAFKHGTGMIEDAVIEISLKAENNILNFTVRNKFNNTTAEEKDKTSGIGLTNVKRRLSLLYGKNHNLWITTNDNWFLVSLQLNMH